jgi:hypothetical protein
VTAIPLIGERYGASLPWASGLATDPDVTLEELTTIEVADIPSVEDLD